MAMTAPVTTTPPGWYPDPHGPGMRWWDGAAWTAHAAPGPDGPTNHDLDLVLPVNVDGCAIAAGYLGLMSFIPNPLTSVPALICGLLALKNIQRSGKRGLVRAWLGIAVGGASFGLFLLMMIAASSSPS